MIDYLIFRLYGPMASWGDIAVGGTRPSYPYPSRSAIMGLVAASLGIKRVEVSRHRELNNGYGFAVRVDSPGIPMSDYHTAQVPVAGKGKNQRIFVTRRDEITTVPKHKLKTILSKRDYYMDACYTIALWYTGNPPYELCYLSEKLNEPDFTLYLGRKSCPLALPVDARVISAETLLSGLQKTMFAELEEFNVLRKRNSSLYWEDSTTSGIEPQHTFTRRDVPLSRDRWQFDTRREHYAVINQKGADYVYEQD